MATVEELYDEAIEIKESGDMEGAVVKLEALVAEHADYALAHTALSVYLEKLDRKDEAVEHAKKVCELEPEDPFSHMAMSIICQKAGQMTEAEQALAKAMEKQWAAHKEAGGQ